MNAFEAIAAGEPARFVAAALELASDAYPGLPIADYLSRIDFIVDTFRSRVPRGEESSRLLTSLNKYFFNELGFEGNTANYYDPRNSYLNDVLERRLGIPISLSVIYREIAMAAGVSLEGINFPGHFLLGHIDEQGAWRYVDVFLCGETLNWNECVARLGAAANDKLDQRQFGPMTDREILVRMLRNLKAIHARGEWHLAVAVMRRLCLLLPDDPLEHRDLAVGYLQIHKPALAAKTIESTLGHFENTPEKATIKQLLARARREAALMN